MENKKDNSLLIRLSDEEMKQLNDGWFLAVSLAGRPVTKSEYIRSCLAFMGDFLKDSETHDPWTTTRLNFLDPHKYDYLNEEE